MDLVLYHFKNKYPRNNMKKIKNDAYVLLFLFFGNKGKWKIKRKQSANIISSRGTVYLARSWFSYDDVILNFTSLNRYFE